MVRHPKAQAFLDQFTKELKEAFPEDEDDDYLPEVAVNLHKTLDYSLIRDRIMGNYSPEEIKELFSEEEIKPCNVRDRYGMTVAHYAAEDGDLDTLRELVGQGADLSLRCNSGHTVRDKAARHGNVEIIQYIDSLNIRG